MPIIVMMMTKSFLEITIPRKTPAKLNTTDVSIMIGEEGVKLSN